MDAASAAILAAPVVNRIRGHRWDRSPINSQGTKATLFQPYLTCHRCRAWLPLIEMKIRQVPPAPAVRAQHGRHVCHEQAQGVP